MISSLLRRNEANLQNDILSFKEFPFFFVFVWISQMVGNSWARYLVETVTGHPPEQTQSGTHSAWISETSLFGPAFRETVNDAHVCSYVTDKGKHNCKQIHGQDEN